MTVPFDKLADLDAQQRLELGSRRLRETLSSVPWYAKKAAVATAEGNEMAYWERLWSSQVNLLHPPVKSSTPKAAPLPSETPAP